jgi:predicted amidophosphoribosyltransferase
MLAVILSFVIIPCVVGIGIFCRERSFQRKAECPQCARDSEVIYDKRWVSDETCPFCGLALSQRIYRCSQHGNRLYEYCFECPARMY